MQKILQKVLRNWVGRRTFASDSISSHTKFHIMQDQRGQYGELTNIPSEIKTILKSLLDGVKDATKTDEHGGWQFGILESNARKGQIHALNYDWYAYGRDLHDGGFLGVIQVREFYRKKQNHFAQIRKSYFLMGQNEDGTYFAHPVSGQLIHAAVKRGADVVKSVQDWIFGTDYAKVIRQGDLCLVPVRAVKGVQIGFEKIIEKSHRLMADAIYLNGDVYAVNPNLVHLNGTHPTIQNLEGKFKVVVGRRAAYWSFAKPTLD